MKHVAFALACATIASILTGCGSNEDSGPSNPAPVAIFTFSGDTQTGQTVFFHNSSTDADSFAWDFDDGGSSSLQDPDYIFSDKGTFVVTLVAYQTSTGRTDTAQQSLTIRPHQVTLSSFTVRTMSFTDDDGDDWDNSDGPDVLPRFFRSGTEIWTLAPINNVLPGDIPLFLRIEPFHITEDFSPEYELRIYDSDESAPDQLIGSIEFSLNDFAIDFDYPSTIILEGSPSSLRIEVTMQWR
jgi:hypothetical protein